MKKRLLIVVVVLAMILGTTISVVQSQDEEMITLTIINTSDEHGWIEPFVPFGSDYAQGGAAMIFSWWVAREGYDPADDSYLLLSGGDNWTGPPISTWFEGAPMVELMNWMGYDASVIGNHEFDFGRDVLDQRISEAAFPYLSANTRFADTNEQVDFADQYVILDAAGLKVGVVGLTTTSTPTVTHPKNITDLAFLDYVPVLEEVVPQMREAGADIILVDTHACMSELANIAMSITVDVDAIFSGHCNEVGVNDVGGIPILGGGWAWRSYARLTLDIDPATKTVTGYDAEVVQVEYPAITPDLDVEDLVAPWEEKVQDALGFEIGYVATELPRRSWIEANWVTDAWLWAFPGTDVAITNFGGLRQEIVAGPLTVGQIVGLLPFENRIVEVELTGAQLAENLACCGGAVGGISYTVNDDGSVEITFLDGRAFDPAATYKVLVNDFMYAGGDGYLFSEQNPDGYDTGVQWRQPVIDWTESLNTSEDDPLENYLDPEPRGPEGQ